MGFRIFNFKKSDLEKPTDVNQSKPYNIKANPYTFWGMIILVCAVKAFYLLFLVNKKTLKQFHPAFLLEASFFLALILLIKWYCHKSD